MKQNVKVVAYYGSQFDSDWPPKGAEAFMQWFAGKLASIPEANRADVKIELDSISSYEDTTYACISIYYWRQETDDEVAERERAERDSHALREYEELQTLSRLKAKYENGG